MANIMRLGGVGSKAPAIFGDGSDGVGLFTESATWLADTEDTGMIIKNYESLTIYEGVTITAGNRNCGMIIRVKGDCTIAGNLVNKLSPRTILDSDGVDFSLYPASMRTSVAGNGGNGGDGGGYSTNGGPAGVGMGGRFYGGGWSGGGGGGGTSKNPGGAGGSVNGTNTASGSLFAGGAAGAKNWGAGGAGQNGGGGGGAGGLNVTGTAGASGAGGSAERYVSSSNSAGTGGGAGNLGGGVIILLVGGNLTITGGFDCSGSPGGNGGENSYNTSTSVYGGGGGGGGGGGRVFICHKGTISNTGTFNVNGGAAGTYIGVHLNGKNGTAGSIGTTAVKTYEQYMEEDVA